MANQLQATRDRHRLRRHADRRGRSRILHIFDRSRQRCQQGHLGLFTRDFSAVSDRDIRLAERALKSDPKTLTALLAAIKSSVVGFQKAYADDGTVRIDITVATRR